MLKIHQVTPKNGRWPEKFLRSQMASLVDQLSKHERRNKQAAINLRTSEKISSSGLLEGKEADCASIFTDMEVNCISAECSAKIISQIHNVLSLILNDLKSCSKHSYGQCEQCETSIGFARLKTIPWATRCVTCQQAKELR